MVGVSESCKEGMRSIVIPINNESCKKTRMGAVDAEISRPELVGFDRRSINDE